MADDNCIFCKMVKGDTKSQKVYEDELMLGILDINPVAKGHILMLPKEHQPILQLLPRETFSHIFGKLPKVMQAVKDAIINTAANVIIASGAAAGQQSPHFLFHIIPREEGDNKDLYAMHGHLNHNGCEQLVEKAQIMLTGTPTGTETIFEDQNIVCGLAKNPIANGHIAIEFKDIKPYEEFDETSSINLFHIASVCASAAFETLTAHGTNIILKTGKSNDNETGRVSVHIIPRMNDDGLKLIIPQMKNKPNLDEIKSSINDKTFKLTYKEEEPKREVINMDLRNDEITEAINNIRNS